MAEYPLLDRTCDRLAAYHGDFVRVTDVPEEHRVVFLVNAATGIIGNGGFHYLLENSFPGDEEFLLTRHAFTAIGADEAVRAFTKAFAVFPNSIPPVDQDERLDMYESSYDLMSFANDKESPDAIFFSTMNDVYRLLESYIEKNAKAFVIPG